MTQALALAILKSGANVFLTGEPGSGKSHTINQYVAYLRACGIEPAVAASTGIAATHIGGMTIHSWSGIGIKKSVTSYDLDRISQIEKVVSRVGKAKVLIIDEISMLDADVLTSVDRVCRALRHRPEPFGGLQVVVVGDFFQLPPISRPGEPAPRFAYESPSWHGASFISCYLTEQFRHDDDQFSALLGNLRSGVPDDGVEDTLRSRYVETHDTDDVATKLFSHNVDVDRINNDRLDKLPGTAHTFSMTSRGSRTLVEQLKRGCLSPELLVLKEGAAVMCTKNSPDGSYVNGTLGTVVSFKGEGGMPVIKTREGKMVTLAYAEWSILDGDKTMATITQIPLRLAWAMTIHKSQGMTLDAAVMDLSRTFEYGQGYVALSRVRKLRGVHLLGWNRRALEVHPKVLRDDSRFREQSQEGSTAFSQLSKAEVDEMHGNFARASGGKWPPDPKELKRRETAKRRGPEPKISTIDQTLRLIKGGKDVNIAEIASNRGLKAGTIIDHIEKLKAGGKLTLRDIEKVVAPDKGVRAMLSDTDSAFAKLGTEKLGPVFSAFGGKYSFDELRIARLLFDSRKGK